MPQSKIRSLQLNSADFQQIVATALGVSSINVTPSAGQALTYTTSTGSPPLALTSSNVGGGGGSGSPFEFVLFTNVAAQSITAAGTVSLNLNDTSQGADEDIWRISSAGDFVIATRTDADGAGNPAITFTRTGVSVDDATIPAPLFLTSSGETQTSTALNISSSQPTIVINDTDGVAGNNVWDIQATAAALVFRTRTDAYGSGATWLTVNRSGTTIGEVAFTGTSLTFNGLAVHVGSPQPTGGSGATVVGSPTNTRFAYFTTSDNITGSANFTFTDSAPTISGSNPRLYIRETDAAANEGNWFYAAINGTYGLFLASDGLPTSGASAWSVTRNGSTGDTMFMNTVDLEVGNGKEFRIADDNQSDWIRMIHDGTDFLSDFTNTRHWKMRGPLGGVGSPNTYGAIWIARSYGSPAFDDIHTGPDKTLLRVGVGSPFYPASGDDVTVDIVDPFGASLVVRNSFQDTGMQLNTHGTNRAEFNIRGSNFFDLNYYDTFNEEALTVWSILPSQGASDIYGDVDWVSFAHSRFKWFTRRDTFTATEDNLNVSTYMVTLASVPSGGTTLTGISSGADGRQHTITNAAGPGSPNASGSITCVHESGSSIASNRFMIGPGSPNVLVIPPYHSVTFIYDEVASRWRLMSTTM